MVASMMPIRLAVLVMLALLPIAAAADECPRTGTETARVAAVIDGNTVRLVDGTVVRLAGIEAPEPPLAAAPEQPWPLADAAASALRKLVTGVDLQLAAATAALDRYHRRHAYLFLAEGRSVAGELVAAGLARARWLPGESACLPALLARERAARAEGLGLWTNPDYAVLKSDDPSLLRRAGLYELVEGRVVSVGHGTSMTFIDFGRNYRSDLTILVLPAVSDALARAGTPVDGLVNRRVLVRGIIEAADGPAIRLNDPAEIELVDGGGGDDESGQR